jgi:hypothetical protein
MDLNRRLACLAARRKTIEVAATAKVSPCVFSTLCTKSSMISWNRSLRPILILNTVINKTRRHSHCPYGNNQK